MCYSYVLHNHVKARFVQVFFSFIRNLNVRAFLEFDPCLLSFSLRKAMVPSLEWLLLLWGLQGLWAQEYGEEYEERNSRKRNRQLPPNVIAQNGQCKSKLLSK